MTAKSSPASSSTPVPEVLEKMRSGKKLEQSQGGPATVAAGLAALSPAELAASVARRWRRVV